jgi:cbb3-type cytochrome oxidase maturation protein
MSITFVLVPLGVVLMAAAVWALFWATNNGQFDDVERQGRAPCDED